MSVRGNLRDVGLFTAARAMMRLASDTRAGRGEVNRPLVCIVVSERRQFAVRRVVAPRAGIVSVPADCRAGRRFRVVMHEGVTKRRNRFHFEFRVANRADLVLASHNRAGRFQRYDPVA